ncbi:hypothetical protein D3C78_900770 [compost metagenome]
MQAAYACLAHQAGAVRHREADIEVVPVLRLADRADRREVPAHLVGQLGLCQQFVLTEHAGGVVPLAAGVDHFATGIELQGTAGAGGVAHALRYPRVGRDGAVVQLVGRVQPVGGEESIEVALAGYRLVQAGRRLVLRLRQLQGAGLPVAPAVGFGEVLGQLAGELVGLFPAAESQQQAQAPFGDGVVTQLRVVLGHQRQGARVEFLRQAQADLPGDGDLFVAGERQPSAVIVEQFQRFLRVLPG